MQKENKRIGILGGTFNPIHCGHIALGIAAYSQFDLSELWVMVSKTPPHKAGQKIPDANIRCDMVRLAISDYPFMKCSEFELQREGYIYTADTLTLLKKQNPEHEYFFILGGDSLAYFENWYHPEIILEHSVILVAGREDIMDSVIDEKIIDLKKQFKHADIRKIDFKPFQCSSTQIRQAIIDEKDVSKMIHPDVEQYIRKKHL